VCCVVLCCVDAVLEWLGWYEYTDKIIDSHLDPSAQNVTSDFTGQASLMAGTCDSTLIRYL